MSLFGSTFTFMSSIFFADIVRSCSHIMTLFPRLIIYFALTLIIFYLFICFSFVLLWYYHLYIYFYSWTAYLFLSFFLFNRLLPSLLCFPFRISRLLLYPLNSVWLSTYTRANRNELTNRRFRPVDCAIDLKRIFDLSYLSFPLSLLFFFLTSASLVSRKVIVVIFKSDDQLAIAKDPITLTLTRTCLS